MSGRLSRSLAALLVLAALAGCRSAAPMADGRRLELSALPASPTVLPSGTIVTVVARPVPEVEMEWVSGTVKMMGAPVLSMKPDAGGKTWRFRTMVPPLVTVPAGSYEVRAWGLTKAGEKLEGLMSYEVQ